MTTPTGHSLHITLPDSKATRARVVYLQPRSERWRPQSAMLHILCSEWLEPHWHPATYHAGDQLFNGQFMSASYESSGNDWLFKGSFELELSGVLAT